MNRNDGGSVFPKEYGEGIPRDEGITLRDYFAAKAMEGELACQLPEWENKDASKLAQWAYEIADAMIKERQKEQPK